MTGTGWKARLSNEGSRQAAWNASDASWAWDNTLTAGTWFNDMGDGNWAMAQDWDWSVDGAGFQVHVESDETKGNLDPYINYGMFVQNTGTGSMTFQQVVTAPVSPAITGSNMVRGSVSGGLTDATGNGVTIVPQSNRTQDGDGSAELQLFLLNDVNDFSASGGYANAGVDVGGIVMGTGPGAIGYGTFAEGMIPGPTSTWEWMQIRTRFSLTGHNDTAVITGYAEITPVPEADTYALLLAGLGLVGFMTYRRKR
jgi:hypothetical protein